MASLTAMLDDTPATTSPADTLGTPKDSAVSATGEPHYGGHEGIVATTGLDQLAPAHRLRGSHPLAAARRALRQKRWVYVFAATQDTSVVCALVNGAVTGSGFMMATDLNTGEVLLDSSRMGARASVNDSPGAGLLATYRLPGTSYRLTREGDDVHLKASLSSPLPSLPGRAVADVEVDLRLREEGTGITAVSRVEHGKDASVSVTAKTAGMPVTGELRLRRDGEMRTVSLDGGYGGYDYTRGMLPRNTAWRWAYGTAPLADGTILGFNLVADFSGVGINARENAVWINGRPSPLDPKTSFAFDSRDVMQPWRITTADGRVRLNFVPIAAHKEYLNFGILKSQFIQPVGHFTGEIDVDGRTYVLDRMPGVCEDQDILW